jgi:deoxyhypusine synthase
MSKGRMSIKLSEFMERHFCHFNAASLIGAARDYSSHIESGGKMVVTLAGAMSTAKIGRTLAEMIRAEKVHLISCTGANLEEDLANLYFKDSYVSVPHYRELSRQDEVDFFDKGLNRVTDVCTPEEVVFGKLDEALSLLWKQAMDLGESYFPHEYLYKVLQMDDLSVASDDDKRDCWLFAAFEKNIPIVVPGWEDSTLGNIFASHCYKKRLEPSVVKLGTETMLYLIDWYLENGKDHAMGFFQIGGGIAGDFPICVVPLIKRDLRIKESAFWSYFCQISDSTTSNGSYSGAVPNEKISWGKLEASARSHVIESDASIVAPLVFAYVLDL